MYRTQLKIWTRKSPAYFLGKPRLCKNDWNSVLITSVSRLSVKYSRKKTHSAGSEKPSESFSGGPRPKWCHGYFRGRSPLFLCHFMSPEFEASERRRVGGCAAFSFFGFRPFNTFFENWAGIHLRSNRVAAAETNGLAPAVLQHNESVNQFSLNNLAALCGHVTVTLHRPATVLQLKVTAGESSKTLDQEKRKSCFFLTETTKEIDCKSNLLRQERKGICLTPILQYITTFEYIGQRLYSSEILEPVCFLNQSEYLRLNSSQVLLPSDLHSASRSRTSTRI